MRRGRRKGVKVAVAVVAVLLTVGVLGPMIYDRLTYGTFAWWQTPTRITYCGRQYLRGSTVTTLPTAEWSHTRVMTDYPEGWDVYASQPRNGGIGSAVPGLPCTMGLVLKQGDNTYVQYGLSGGP